MDSRKAVPIEVKNLTKRYGAQTAVQNLSFRVEPGQITGFLGPNGAGKTTTLRILMNLASPDSGTALFGGYQYRDFPVPAQMVGASFDVNCFHPGRTGRDHLRVLAAATDTYEDRIEYVLDWVGLRRDADRRTGTYSLGMRQRLGMASALLTDPPILVLDEPATGLDPEGIRWLRHSLRSLADNGRTILLSSHMLGEVQQIADNVVIIDHGRLVAADSVKALGDTGNREVAISASKPQAMFEALRERGLNPRLEGETIMVPEVSLETVSQIAISQEIVLYRLETKRSNLEEVFLRVIGGQG